MLHSKTHSKHLTLKRRKKHRPIKSTYTTAHRTQHTHHHVHTAPNHITAPEGYQHPYLDQHRHRMISKDITSYSQLKNFQIPLPYAYNIGVDITDKHVFEGRGFNPAIIYTDGENHARDVTVNFNFLADQSNKLCNALTSFGIQRGDCVGVLMSQSIEVAIMHAAITKLGAITVPLSLLFGPDALEYRISTAKCKALFMEPNRFDIFREIQAKIPSVENVIISPHLSSLDDNHLRTISPEERDNISTYQYENELNMAKNSHAAPKIHYLSDILYNNHASKLYNVKMSHVNDPAVIIFTSGTTNLPKPALHGHSVLLGHLPGVEFFYDQFPVHSGSPLNHGKPDVIYSGGDVSWIGGLFNVLLTSMHHGVPVVQHRSSKFDPEKTLNMFQKLNVTTSFLPPTCLKLMREVPNVKDRFSNLSLRSIGSGGEMLGESVVSWCQKELNVTPHEFYGQTECNLIIGNNSRLTPVKAGSMGVVIPGQDAHVITAKGEIAEPGQVGEIAVRVSPGAPHPIMFKGYVDRQKATQEKYLNEWFLTGDLAKRDEDGYFFYCARQDDIISSAGYRIGPGEIETTLIHHDAVANSAVVGIPDEIRGEVVKAFVMASIEAQNRYFGSPEEYRTFVKNYPHFNDYPKDSRAIQLSHELMSFVKNRLAKHEYPRQVEFVADLETTTTGKVIRKGLKKQEYELYYNKLGKPIPEGIF